MDDEARWVDGNAVAGLLLEVFGTELTTQQRGCQSCGAVTRLGAHRAYRGAGTVLRCPVCGDLALRIATLADRHAVVLSGTWTFEVMNGPS